MRLRNAILVCLVCGLASMPWGCGKPPDPPRPETTADLDPSLKEAFATALRAVEENPGNDRSWQELGLTYHANARPDLAAACYEVLVARNPGDARVHALRAMALDDVGDRSGRLESMRKAVEHDPRNVEYQWQLSRYQLSDGQADQACVTAEEARSIDGNNVQAAHALAHALLEAEQDARAETVLKAWLVKQPGDLHAHHLLGVALRNQGRALSARGHVAAGMGSGPDWHGAESRVIETWARGPQALRTRGLALVDAGEADQAVTIFNHLVSGYPDDATLVLNLGMATAATGDSTTAESLYEQAVRMDPELDIAHRQLAGLELRGRSEAALRGDADALGQAEAHLRRAQEIAPDSAATNALLGRVMVLQGRTAEAAELLAKASIANPGDLQLGFSTANLLLDEGRHDDAMSIIEVMRVLRPDDPQLVVLSAAVHSGRGDLETARTLLQQAQRRWPRHPGVKAAITDLEASQ
ncbi:MAG: tetratricopeptide repeat protein [Phycisphaerales bacterium]|nr:tetratricopeptide repeat protein [Phycisphaerales bacterium]